MEDREERQDPQRNQEVNVNTRDRLFHAIFLKVGLVYTRTVPKAVRTGMEVILLTKAIILFAVLTYIHFTFSKQPMNCLDSILHDWPRDGILRVQVLLGQDTITPTPPSSSLSLKKNTSDNGMVSRPSENKMRNYTLISYHFYENDKVEKKKSSTSYLQSFFDLVVDANKVPGRDAVVDNFHFKGMEKFMKGYQNMKEQYIMEFSLEYGFLRLSPMTRQKLRIPIKVVNLDPNKDQCFGDSVSKFLLSHFLGYDDVLIASIKRLAEMEDNRGFMRNVITGEHYRFVSVWMSRSSYIIAFLLMFVFTISVATLLRFCHQQIFFFIVHLLQMLDWNVAVAFPVAPLFTVILSLVGIRRCMLPLAQDVTKSMMRQQERCTKKTWLDISGMEVIMSEFFNDTSTSFYIILIVWAADQFDSICCHTTVSQKYWLRFFYLYHFVFYAYHYRFNGQYSSIALASSWFFIQHSMLYFLHNYELPAIENQVERGLEGVADTIAEVGDAIELLYDGVQWPLLVDPHRDRGGGAENPEPIHINEGVSQQDSGDNIAVRQDIPSSIQEEGEYNQYNGTPQQEVDNRTVISSPQQSSDDAFEHVASDNRVVNSCSVPSIETDTSYSNHQRTYAFLPNIESYFNVGQSSVPSSSTMGASSLMQPETAACNNLIKSCEEVSELAETEIVDIQCTKSDHCRLKKSAHSDEICGCKENQHSR